ncbi:MAG: hypothetical protein VW684_10155, partial [Betaproteobacteria bacterium]
MIKANALIEQEVKTTFRTPAPLGALLEAVRKIATARIGRSLASDSRESAPLSGGGLSSPLP